MSALGGGIIAIYIPVLIVAFSNLYQTKKNQDLITLDHHVILKNYFDFKKIIPCFLFLFLPAMLWVLNSITLQIILFALYIFAIGGSLYYLHGIWSWLRGDVNHKVRQSFLAKESNFDILRPVWLAIWQSKELAIVQERDFFNIFKKRVFACVEKKEYKKCSQLLWDFNNFYENRGLDLAFAHEDFLEPLLTLHEKLMYEEEKKDKYDHGLFSATRALDKITDQVWMVLSGGEFSGVFVKSLRRHILNINKDANKAFLQHYLRKIFNFIYQDFPNDAYEYLNSISFPEEWKIKSENLGPEKNKEIVFELLLLYLRKFQAVVMKHGEGADKLELFTKELFPNIDPEQWSLILMFAMYCHGDIKKYLETESTIEFLPKPRLYSGKSAERERMKKEEDEVESSETFRILMMLWDDVFTFEAIVQWLEEIEKAEGRGLSDAKLLKLCKLKGTLINLQSFLNAERE